VCTACSIPARNAAIQGGTLESLRDASSSHAPYGVPSGCSVQHPLLQMLTRPSIHVGVSAANGVATVHHRSVPDASTSLFKPKNSSQPNFRGRGPRMRPLGIPEGYKCCNLCSKVRQIAAFQQSSKAPARSYCHHCMPSVRRGMQMGIRMNKLRRIYKEGGLVAVQSVTGATPSGCKGKEGGSSSTPTESMSQ
jgi:hypothetical protein